MSVTNTGTLTTVTDTCALTLSGNETLAQFQLAGTYTTAGVVVEASKDATNFATVVSYTGTGTANTGTISPSNSSTNLLLVPCAGYSAVRVRLTAIASGSIAVVASAAAYVGLPQLGSVTNGGTFSGVTFAGTSTFTGNTVDQIQVVSANGAITIKSGTAWITKGTAATVTLAAPTATTDDGCRLMIVSTTAAAHTVANASPGFNNGGGASDVATFGATIANGFEVEAYQGAWYVLNTPVGVTLG